jgi:hypothetical protein
VNHLETEIVNAVSVATMDKSKNDKTIPIRKKKELKKQTINNFYLFVFLLIFILASR